MHFTIYTVCSWCLCTISRGRLLLGEIVPAFKGIAMKLVPDAKPALDCPVLFPFSPNAVIIGFITTTIGTVIAMFLFPTIGLAMIIPGILTNFSQVVRQVYLVI